MNAIGEIGAAVLSTGVGSDYFARTFCIFEAYAAKSPVDFNVFLPDAFSPMPERKFSASSVL